MTAKKKQKLLQVSEAEKNLMRERMKKAKLHHFKKWEDVKDSFVV